MRPARFPTLCFAAALLLALLAAPAAFAKDDEVVEIKVAEEEIEMQDFLRVVSRATNVPLVWNPADKNIRGKKIIGNIDLKMPRGELFSYARALLTFYELVMIPVGPRNHQVQLVMDARQTSSILKLKPRHVNLTDENLAEFEHADGEFLTTTIQVEHMDDLRNARNALTRIVTGQNIGNVTEVPAAKAFVVTDFAPNVVAIYRLLRTMDRPQPKDSTTRGRTVAVTLEHATARELASTLNQHFMGRPGRPVPRGQPPAPSADAPRITHDERTNRILVTGDDAEIEAVKNAIALLDTPVAAPRVAAHVLVLENIEASTAANLLTSLIGRSPGLWAAGVARPAVLPGPTRSTLLVSASEADLAEIRKLLQEMDKAR